MWMSKGWTRATSTSIPTATGSTAATGSRGLGNGRFDAYAYGIPDHPFAIPNISFVRSAAVTVVDWERSWGISEGGGAEGKGGRGVGLRDCSGG